MFRFVRPSTGSSSTLSTKEQTLLAATVGAGRYRVLTRRPLTIAFGPHAWLPALGGAVCGFAFSYRHGLGFGLAVATVAGAAQMVSLAVHEAGHLLSSRAALGVSPRMLLMRSSGGVAIVEGRFKEPRGAALFAAGGPLATVLLTIVLVLAGVIVSPGPLGIGLLVAAFSTSSSWASTCCPWPRPTVTPCSARRSGPKRGAGPRPSGARSPGVASSSSRAFRLRSSCLRSTSCTAY